MNATTQARYLKRIRLCIWIIIIGLFVSGVTAFPLETELRWLAGHSAHFPAAMQYWLLRVSRALQAENLQYPFLSYGTDWLAFAHLVIAIAFIGPLRNPVKNIWVIQFGIIACLLIFPLAFIAGPVRQIPLYWRFIDCSFGIIGIVPLLIAHYYTRQMEKGQ